MVANIITESMYAQFHPDGDEYLILKLLEDYKKDGTTSVTRKNTLFGKYAASEEWIHIVGKNLTSKSQTRVNF